MTSENTIREAVQRRYAAIARSGSSCCAPRACGATSHDQSQTNDRSEHALEGLGCGHPVQLAALRPGETVVDLGSGGGLDVVTAAGDVGSRGRVIGIDMTAEMLARAREYASRLGLGNVEFREGLIEALPLEDACADVVLSNCVINLAANKQVVFQEAFRVLKPGGRLVVSDVVATRPLPPEIRADEELWASCIGGAMPEDEYLDAIR